MKIRNLLVLAGVAAPLIMTGSSDAGFVGLSVSSFDVTWGGATPGSAFVVRIYAEFDAPGDDLINAAFGSPEIPMDISVVGGTFYQHPLGSAKAPNSLWFPTYPSLEWDSFVSIGVIATGGSNPLPTDPTTLTPGFETFWGPSTLGGDNLGWLVTPLEPTADPFNPATQPGGGVVFLGQFSTQDGIGVQGVLGLQYQSDGVPALQSVESFEALVPSPGALGLLGLAALAGSRRPTSRRKRSGRPR